MSEKVASGRTSGSTVRAVRAAQPEEGPKIQWFRMSHFELFVVLFFAASGLSDGDKSIHSVG